MRTLVAIALALAAFQAHALNIGDEVPVLQMKDAKDVEHTLGDEVRRIYYSGDRDSGGAMKEAAPTQAQLDAQHAVAIANIADAPGFVKYLIRKSMNDRAYTTWLDASGATKPLFPVRPGQVTIIELQARKITAIRYAPDVAAIRNELK